MRTALLSLLAGFIIFAPMRVGAEEMTWIPEGTPEASAIIQQATTVYLSSDGQTLTIPCTCDYNECVDPCFYVFAWFMSSGQGGQQDFFKLVDETCCAGTTATPRRIVIDYGTGKWKEVIPGPIGTVSEGDMPL